MQCGRLRDCVFLMIPETTGDRTTTACVVRCMRMRRILSILLLLVLTAGPLGFATPADVVASGWTGVADESHLPACCKRYGVHHCAMHSGDASKGQTAVSSAISCPFVPGTVASTAPSAALASGAGQVATRMVELRAISGSERAARKCVRHGWPKRGPPGTPFFS